MPVKNTAIIILGASGDLARRKLIPALARLYERGLLDDSSIVIGSGRSAFNRAEFCSRFKLKTEFKKLLNYHQGISGLDKFIRAQGNFKRFVFFMALPPAAYAPTAAALFNEGFKTNTSLIIEKPFGYDYASAHQLNQDLQEYYDESAIFRIDHYLAKEAVQNILVFRFANSIFYPIWNSRYIKSIQISAAEELGVEDRGSYFDQAGIIRDMVQNHLLQLLCLLTMEAPITLDPEDIRSQKINILKAVQVTDCKRLQYQGYRGEKNVRPDSTTETFAEMKLYINNFRWTGMPVYIRAGKALNRRGTEVAIVFKKLPRLLFNKDNDLPANRIIFKIQPAEGIILDLSSKEPGQDMRITGTNMAFCYNDSFKGEIPEAYQKLLLDALHGDKTLFVSAEETEIAWQKIQDFMDVPSSGEYPIGSLPPSPLGVKWIDFSAYGDLCR